MCTFIIVGCNCYTISEVGLPVCHYCIVLYCQMLMNVRSRLHAAFLIRNVSTFQDLLSVAVKLGLLLAAMAAV